MKSARSAGPTTSPSEPPAGRAIVTVAGRGVGGSAGDGGPAVQLGFPSGLAVDAAGNVYIADHANHRVRRLDGDGVVVTVAGDGVRGDGGDGGAAGAARLGFPAAVAVDAHGNLFIADEVNHRVRRVDPEVLIDTVAGDGSRGGAGDGGAATAAQLSSPCSVAVDAAGVLYIADTDNRRVRRVDGVDGEPDARPGRHTDGAARIGAAAPVVLHATVLGPETDG
ncbi:Teneurin-2 [Kitasatospora sp. NPDC017646]|uniref:Teneurin-2 n=1 Tax=Kitasatospora sp. NPDC017646 TaxID=3364024 RepID=UPI0037A4566C